MSPKESKKSKKQAAINPALKYSGMAMSMAISVAIGLFLGKWIDRKLGYEDPVFALILIIVFLSVFMFYLVKSVSQDSSE